MVTLPPQPVPAKRLVDPPREVEHNRRWWPRFQYTWRLCDDHRGWMADVSWAEKHEWGLGTYRPMVRPEMGRLVEEGQKVPVETRG